MKMLLRLAFNTVWSIIGWLISGGLKIMHSTLVNCGADAIVQHPLSVLFEETYMKSRPMTSNAFKVIIICYIGYGAWFGIAYNDMLIYMYIHVS